MAVSVTSTPGAVTLTQSTPAGDITPDEARRVAVSLIEHAARAENPTEASTWP